MNEVDSALDGVIRGALEMGERTDLRAIAYRETSEWDSVGHMRLVAALESHYGLVLSSEELFGLVDYGAIITVVNRHLSGERQANGDAH